MRLFFVLSSVLFLSACVTSETTVTTKNTGATIKTQFDPQSVCRYACEACITLFT
ncbi:hypothetical protein ACLKMH_20030 [Psychromonas sp. KJ10-10]|uniref:hypothetical protein n=1 Tax=Psychromonas sp. KJ10-10 TaxID=3391823 RepID=UPI0039B57938